LGSIYENTTKSLLKLITTSNILTQFVLGAARLWKILGKTWLLQLP